MKLSIIILNHNTRDLLKQTLESINTKLSHQIIVVDNASTDDSVNMVKRHFPHVRIILSSKNKGFAAGNNIGLKEATGDYSLLLNSDTKIVGNAIDQSVNFLDLNPEIGILTPKLVLADGALDLASHRGFPTLANSLTYFLKLEQVLPNFKLTSGYHQTYKDFDQTHQVDAVSGAAMFVRKQVFNDIGFLDERFFMYAEDIDFCKRAKDKGWQVVYYPHAKVIHYKGSSGTNSVSKKLRSQTRHHFYDTMKLYFEKHHDYPEPFRWLVHKGVDFIARIKG